MPERRVQVGWQVPSRLATRGGWPTHPAQCHYCWQIHSPQGGCHEGSTSTHTHTVYAYNVALWSSLMKACTAWSDALGHVSYHPLPHRTHTHTIPSAEWWHGCEEGRVTRGPVARSWYHSKFCDSLRMARNPTPPLSWFHSHHHLPIILVSADPAWALAQPPTVYLSCWWNVALWNYEMPLFLGSRYRFLYGCF